MQSWGRLLLSQVEPSQFSQERSRRLIFSATLLGPKQTRCILLYTLINRPYTFIGEINQVKGVSLNLMVIFEMALNFRETLYLVDLGPKKGSFLALKGPKMTLFALTRKSDNFTGRVLSLFSCFAS